MKHKSQTKKTYPPATKIPAKPQAKEGGAWIIIVTLIFVLIAFLPVFNAGFVNWDDDDYVVKNKAITSLSNMESILTVPVQGNYHPLTMLSLAIGIIFFVVMYQRRVIRHQQELKRINDEKQRELMQGIA